MKLKGTIYRWLKTHILFKCGFYYTHPTVRRVLRRVEKASEQILPAHMHSKLTHFLKFFLVKSLTFFLDQTSINNAPKIEKTLSVNEQEDFFCPIGNLSSNHKIPCDLVICCAFTERHKILASAILESFQSKYKNSIHWVLCGTTKEDKLFIENMVKTTGRVSGFICPNHPLGQKWQHCVSFANQHYHAQLYSIIGSDDLMSSKLIDYILHTHRINQGRRRIPALYATPDWLVLVNDLSNFAAPQIFRCTIRPSEHFQPIGAGRFYTYNFLQQVGFEIFDVKLSRLLDDLGYFKVKKAGHLIKLYTVEDAPLISVKGSWSQLNTVRDFFSAKTLELNEFSFKGYEIIKGACSETTADYLFKQKDLVQHLSFKGYNDLAFTSQ